MTSEVTTVRVEKTANTDMFVDLAAIMSAFNHKQYHQCKKDGTPLCYAGVIRAAEDNTTSGVGSNAKVVTALPNWVTRNAVKKTAVGWKKQLKHAGVRIRDLPTYGQRFRTTLTEAGQADIARPHQQAGGPSITVRGLQHNLEPVDGAGGSIFNSYFDSSDHQVIYETANTITELAITDASGTTTTAYPALTGTGSGADEFFIIDEFIQSRRNMDTYEEDAPGPSSSSKMTSLFSVAEEMSDDIIEAVEDYGDNRPYDANGNSDSLMTWGWVGSTRAQTSTTTDLVPQASVSFKAPLGLLQLKEGAEGASWLIDIHAIYEM